jgi:GntR family transcriptional regulator
MVFELNYKSAKPVYLQVVDQVKAAVASGSVRAGDALPSIRPLAEELRVNRNTIAKAYGELENQGVIETLAGKGCFITGHASPLRKDARLKLDRGIDDAVIAAHHLQGDKPEFLRLGWRPLRDSNGARARFRTDTHDCPNPAIDITNLSGDGRTDAVNGLSLRVQPGRCLRLLRLRNGAGKTTRSSAC